MAAAPLSPAELSRRAEVAMAARINGALHQAETLPAPAPQAAPNGAAAAPAPVDELMAHAPIDTWLCDAHGLVRWRPVTDRLDVVELPGGASLLVLPNGFRIKLARDQSGHLSRLLDPDNRRRTSDERGGE